MASKNPTQARTYPHRTPQFHLLASKCVCQTAQYDGIKESNASKDVSPSDSTVSELVVVRLFSANGPNLIIVPPSREGEDSDGKTESRQELHSPADLENI